MSVCEQEKQKNWFSRVEVEVEDKKLQSRELWMMLRVHYLLDLQQVFLSPVAGRISLFVFFSRRLLKFQLPERH